MAAKRAAILLLLLLCFVSLSDMGGPGNAKGHGFHHLASILKNL